MHTPSTLHTTDASRSSPLRRRQPTHESARESAREELAIRRRRSVADLLRTRTDLVGVSSLADLMNDSVRWTA